MIHFTDVSGLLGSVAAITVVVSRTPGMARMARAHRRVLRVAVAAAVLVPLGDLPLAAYVRGAIGDLSIPSLILLAAAFQHTWRDAVPRLDRSPLLLLIAGTAAGFYPLALGWGGFDPYRLGFGSYGFLACLLALASLAVLKRLTVIAICISLSVLAWSAGWYESTNLWDYLLDPLVSIYAALALAVQAVRRGRCGPRPPT